MKNLDEYMNTTIKTDYCEGAYIIPLVCYLTTEHQFEFAVNVYRYHR